MCLTETYVRMIKCSGVYSVNLRAYSLSPAAASFLYPDSQLIRKYCRKDLFPRFCRSFLRGRAAISFFRKVFCRNHNKSVKVDAKAYLLALVVRGNFPSLAGPILWYHNVNCFEYLNVSAVAELLPSKDIDIFLPCQFALKFCSGVVYSMIFVPSRFRQPRGMNTCLHSLRFPNHIKILFLSASSVLFSAFRRHPQSFCGWHSFHTCVLSVKFLFTIGAPSECLFSFKIFSASPSELRLVSALPLSAFIAFFSLYYIY